MKEQPLRKFSSYRASDGFLSSAESTLAYISIGGMALMTVFFLLM